MKGVFKIDETRINEIRRFQAVRLIKGLSAVYLVFLVVFFLSKDPENGSQMLLFISIIIGSAGAFGLWLTRVVKYSSANTIIEIDDKKITRKGKGLLTTQIHFNEIGKIMKRPNGLILIRKGIGVRINYYLNKYALTSEDGIIFIPSILDHYQDLVVFFERKVTTQ